MFLIGDRFTFADLFLFQTLIRFDTVYYAIFKCTMRTIQSYHNLSRFVLYFYNIVGLKKYIDMDQIIKHYFSVYKILNPSGIIPINPKLWWF